MKGSCQACGLFRDLDRCHIKTAKTGGAWEDDNILLLCRVHHQMQHTVGFTKLVLRYPNLLKILNNKGWELQNVFGVTKLVKTNS